MKLNFFGKKSKCLKCAKKFGNETELMEHNRTAHATYDSILSTKVMVETTTLSNLTLFSCQDFSNSTYRSWNHYPKYKR